MKAKNNTSIKKPRSAKLRLSNTAVTIPETLQCANSVYDPKICEELRALEEQATKEPVSICLDWLTLYYQTDVLFDQISEGDIIELTDDAHFVVLSVGNVHFKNQMHLVYKGDVCATLLLNSRNEKFFRKDIIKVDFRNHVLYNDQWQELHLILLGLGLKFKSAGRVDIAIDGMNSLHKILNIYSKQPANGKAIFLLNSSMYRGQFNPGILNPVTMLHENFRIGSTKGAKMISVYNKSQEIAKSGKAYIQEYWLKNGVIRELQDLEAQAREIKKREKSGYMTFHMEGYENIYRFELRLMSEAIKAIEDFSLDMLTSSKSLASIVKTHCAKFFELRWRDDEKVTRCRALDTIPYERFNAKTLTRINRVPTDGIYNAKTTAKGIIKDIYRCRIAPQNMAGAVDTIIDRCHRYRIADYVTRKMPEWEKEFFPTTPRAEQARVLGQIAHITHLLSTDSQESTADVAARHGQAGATAAFGEDIPVFDD